VSCWRPEAKAAFVEAMADVPAGRVRPGVVELELRIRLGFQRRRKINMRSRSQRMTSSEGNSSSQCLRFAVGENMAS
jgi:hypothetical protein